MGAGRGGRGGRSAVGAGCAHRCMDHRPAGAHGVAAGAARLLRPARVGDGAPAAGGGGTPCGSDPTGRRRWWSRWQCGARTTTPCGYSLPPRPLNALQPTASPSRQKASSRQRAGAGKPWWPVRPFGFGLDGIVYLTRASLRRVNYRDRKKVAAQMRRIHAAPTEEAARASLDSGRAARHRARPRRRRTGDPGRDRTGPRPVGRPGRTRRRRRRPSRRAVTHRPGDGRPTDAERLRTVARPARTPKPPPASRPGAERTRAQVSHSVDPDALTPAVHTDDPATCPW